jgi:hypothetical protein
MFVLRRIKQAVADSLNFRSIFKHQSRLGRTLAPRYTAYLQQCRRAFEGGPDITPDLQQVAEEFDRKGFTSFWTAENKKLADAILVRIQEEEQRGLDIWDENHRYREDIYLRFPEIEQLFQGSLGAFLMATYQAYFKIFYGVLYKSERLLDSPTGSQLWHSDGGPGTCINVMFCLSDVEKEDGAMECLPWKFSLELYKNEPSAIRRRLAMAKKRGQPSPSSKQELRPIQCDYYREQISRYYSNYVEQPTGKAGLVLPFRNNIMHKGGYPEPSRKRYVCVFHCYPSHRQTPYERYRKLGIKKMASYPVDPAEDF